MGKRLTAQALESGAEVGVYPGPDPVDPCSPSSHVEDVAGVVEDEAEPEAQQWVVEIPAHLAGRRPLVGQRIAPPQVAQLAELAQVVVPVARIEPGGPGDVLVGRMPRGNGSQKGIVVLYLSQQEVAFAKERRVLGEKLPDDISLYLTALGKVA